MAGHALVVGATSDIGAAIVRRLVAGGRHVVAWGRSEVRLASLRDEHTGSVTTRQVDVTDPGAVAAGLSAIDEAIGSSDPPSGHLAPALDVAVWGAGVFDWGPADGADPETWAQLLEVNLVAAARWTPQILRRLRATSATGQPSTLVFVGSGAAHRVYPDNAAYVASKHGLAALAASTFLDVKRHGIQVSVVSPGLVAAGAGLWSPQGQDEPTALLQPVDVADAVGYVVDFPGHGCPVLIELQPLI
ncbi:SDR family oxidoreductase [Alloalcanivorax gelatiniphagus]